VHRQAGGNVPSSAEHSSGVPWSLLKGKKNELLLQQAVMQGKIPEI